MSVYLLVGALAYPILFLHDLAARAHRRLFMLILGAAGALLLVGSYGMLWRSMPGLHIPAVVRIAGFVSAGVFFVLLVYSLLIEIPFRKTYIDDIPEDTLIDSGTYALCRHPGVIWWLGFLLSTFAAGGRTAHLAAAVIWTALNALYAAGQERIFYPHIFGEEQYDRYKSSVPMFVPTRSSLVHCCSTLRFGRR